MQYMQTESTPPYPGMPAPPAPPTTVGQPPIAPPPPLSNSNAAVGAGEAGADVTISTTGDAPMEDSAGEAGAEVISVPVFYVPPVIYALHTAENAPGKKSERVDHAKDKILKAETPEEREAVRELLEKACTLAHVLNLNIKDTKVMPEETMLGAAKAVSELVAMGKDVKNAPKKGGSNKKNTGEKPVPTETDKILTTLLDLETTAVVARKTLFENTEQLTSTLNQLIAKTGGLGHEYSAIKSIQRFAEKAMMAMFSILTEVEVSALKQQTTTPEQASTPEKACDSRISLMQALQSTAMQKKTDMPSNVATALLVHVLTVWAVTGKYGLNIIVKDGLRQSSYEALTTEHKPLLEFLAKQAGVTLAFDFLEAPVSKQTPAAKSAIKKGVTNADSTADAAAAEEEEKRLAAEEEEKRLAAEEAIRLAAEEAIRLAAEEAIRLAAEEEEAIRLAAKAKEAEQLSAAAETAVWHGAEDVMQLITPGGANEAASTSRSTRSSTKRGHEQDLKEPTSKRPRG